MYTLLEKNLENILYSLNVGDFWDNLYNNIALRVSKKMPVNGRPLGSRVGLQNRIAVFHFMRGISTVITATLICFIIFKVPFCSTILGNGKKVKFALRIQPFAPMTEFPVQNDWNLKYRDDTPNKSWKALLWKDKHIHMGPVVRSTISASPGLPDNLLFWFCLFWLKNPAQTPQLKTCSYIPETC